MKNDSSLFSCTDLTVSFGGVHAVKAVNLEVQKGQVVGLIGPNGAGKTTTIDAITGFVRSTGKLRLRGRDLTSQRAHERARSGMARTWQSIELFDDLTVEQNLAVAAHHPTSRAARWKNLTSRGRPNPVVEQCLLKMGLDNARSRMPSELSQGHRKLVGVARALAQQPLVLCLDEPAAGLDATESLRFGAVIRKLADDGLGVLLVEHDMGMILRYCDVVYVLEFGSVIAKGPPETVARDSRVIEAYLGSAKLTDAEVEARQE